MYAIIKSNQGNHTGFNRRWELMDVCPSKDEASEKLFQLALYASDDNMIMEDDSRSIIDNNSGEEVYHLKEDYFNYDGRQYRAITNIDIDSFNGGVNGYLNNEIIKSLN
jgi:hypothetical protein